MNRLEIKLLLKTTGIQIRGRRMEKLLTQIQLGEMVGLPVEVISGLEKGLKDVTLMKLADIANALNCGIYDLIPNIQTIKRVMADEVDRHSEKVHS